jgi:hypothetical protein
MGPPFGLTSQRRRPTVTVPARQLGANRRSRTRGAHEHRLAVEGVVRAL